MSPSVHKRHPIVAVLLVLLTVAYLLALVGFPIAAVVYNAFAEGWEAFRDAILDDETQHALRLTLLVCAIVVPLNTIFGLAAAWVLARQRFVCRGTLAAFVNLPLALSPTIVGLLIVLAYSPTIGMLREPVNALHLKILFATPALVLATLLVTMPLVALEVLPSLEHLDGSEEQAAMTLGATAWQTFRKVIFPAIRWSVVYGVVLCLAKAAGEFGAVSGVSGKLIGETNTLTLHIERTYGEWETTQAFASSTLLTGLALITLLINLVLSKPKH